MYDIEDEVDWSDGTLASPPPLTMGPSLQSPAAYATDQANDFQLASQTKSPGLHVHLRKIYPHSRWLVETDLSENVIDGKSSTSTAVPQDPFILASNSTQRPPLSHEDVSRFALYQANQKTYEALFLRTYVSQALDPQKLDLQNSLTDNPGLLPALRDYLKTVTHNVNSLTDKMIWNAHFKCVNFLAAGRDIGLPFVNVDGLKADTFEGFGPGNPYPVVDLMNQSWHLTDCRLNMVQYCGEDYPIEHEGKGRSPFDELQETRRELSHCPPNSGMPPGRIIQYPLGQITNGNAVPKAAVVGENDMEAKPLAPVPQSRRRAPNRKTDQNKYASVKKRKFSWIMKSLY